MKSLYRVAVAALISPIAGTVGFGFWIPTWTTNSSEILLYLKIGTVFSYVWFLVFFAPMVFAFHAAKKATVPNLTMLGVVSGAVCSSAVEFFLLLLSVGHGQVGSSLAVLLAEGALFGAALGAAISLTFALVSGITIRSSGPLRMGAV